MKPEDVAKLIEAAGGKVEEMSGPLSDGSGFATASSPLPEDHWLTRPGWNEPPMPWACGTDDPARNDMAEAIRAAGRYAIRASTMNGSGSFDPDAMLQNLVVGLIGYWSPDGR